MLCTLVSYVAVIGFSKGEKVLSVNSFSILDPCNYSVLSGIEAYEVNDASLIFTIFNGEYW